MPVMMLLGAAESKGGTGPASQPEPCSCLGASSLSLTVCWQPPGESSWAPPLKSPYFPMQNRLKMESSTSSVTSSPLTSPSASTAARRSMVQKSTGRSSAGAPGAPSAGVAEGQGCVQGRSSRQAGRVPGGRGLGELCAVAFAAAASPAHSFSSSRQGQHPPAMVCCTRCSASCARMSASACRSFTAQLMPPGASCSQSRQGPGTRMGRQRNSGASS